MNKQAQHKNDPIESFRQIIAMAESAKVREWDLNTFAESMNWARWLNSKLQQREQQQFNSNSTNPIGVQKTPIRKLLKSLLHNPYTPKPILEKVVHSYFHYYLPQYPHDVNANAVNSSLIFASNNSQQNRSRDISLQLLIQDVKEKSDVLNIADMMLQLYQEFQSSITEHCRYGSSTNDDSDDIIRSEFQYCFSGNNNCRIMMMAVARIFVEENIFDYILDKEAVDLFSQYFKDVYTLEIVCLCIYLLYQKTKQNDPSVAHSCENNSKYKQRALKVLNAMIAALEYNKAEKEKELLKKQSMKHHMELESLMQVHPFVTTKIAEIYPLFYKIYMEQLLQDVILLTDSIHSNKIHFHQQSKNQKQQYHSNDHEQQVHLLSPRENQLYSHFKHLLNSCNDKVRKFTFNSIVEYILLEPELPNNSAVIKKILMAFKQTGAKVEQFS